MCGVIANLPPDARSAVGPRLPAVSPANRVHRLANSSWYDKGQRGASHAGHLPSGVLSTSNNAQGLH